MYKSGVIRLVYYISINEKYGIVDHKLQLHMKSE